MAIERWDPFREAVSLSDAMNALLRESFIRPSSNVPGQSGPTPKMARICRSQTVTPLAESQYHVPSRAASRARRSRRSERAGGGEPSMR